MHTQISSSNVKGDERLELTLTPANNLEREFFNAMTEYASLQSTKDKDRIAELEKEVEMLRGLVGKAMEWVSISTLFFDEETNSWDDLFIKGTPCTTPELVELFLKENKQP